MWKWTTHTIQTCEDDDCDTFTFFKLQNESIHSDYVFSDNKSMDKIVASLNSGSKNISFERGYFGMLRIDDDVIFGRAQRSNELESFSIKLKIEMKQPYKYQFILLNQPTTILCR